MSTNNYFIALAAIVPTITTATETTTALLVATGVDGNGPGPQANAVVTGWRGLPSPHAGRGSVLSPHNEADMGVLATVQRRLQSNTCPTSCPPEQVGYCVGSPISTINGGLICDGKCCVNNNDCVNFTGCVSRDGSCSGSYACYDAFAPGGIENSCKGYSACEGLGLSGVVGALKNSCNANTACLGLARDGGNVGALTQSCNGYYACMNLARNNGEVGMLSKSCNGYFACERLGNKGFVGSIMKSCIRDYSCQDLATNFGFIASITKTCNNAKNTPCQLLDKEGAVGHLTKFTHAQILAGKKYTREVIGTIEDCNTQCADDSECMGIKWKDHTGMPCRFYGGDISANLCGGKNVCITNF